MPPLGVSELFHFSRRFLPNYEPERLSQVQMEQVGIKELCGELGDIEAAFGKPFMSKAKMLHFNMSNVMQALQERQQG